MNVVDSSGWLEFFADGPNAEFFAEPLMNPDRLVVPAISVFEVFKRILQQRDESAALEAAALMEQGTVVDLDASLALAAAKCSVDLGLPMADSIIFTTARQYEATLWTQDSDFKGLDGVKFIAKGKPPGA
ncbi:MAG: type II toxin-antitoxin system VapC family toxin [Candidatus Dadabacteria bacterium]|nr:MAG: type II toxin-antitoxin system VapC family toxin [Candidatus Dadabacteria bacterium]